MGAEPYLLASSVTCIVAQRVLRKIHDKCKTKYTPDPKIVEEIKAELGSFYPASQEPALFKGTGDEDCDRTGYHGRVGMFEVLPVTEKIGKAILERSASTEIEKLARDEGMITLKQDGFLKVLEGTTTIEEVLRVGQD